MRVDLMVQRLQLGDPIFIGRWALKMANFHEFRSAKPASELLEQSFYPRMMSIELYETRKYSRIRVTNFYEPDAIISLMDESP
jgi:hypothetical protein